MLRIRTGSRGWIEGRVYGRVITIIFSALILGACKKDQKISTLPYYTEENLSPTWIADDSVEMIATHRLGTFSLVDQEGNRVTREMLQGKLAVIDFFFTRCPGICPTLTGNMGRLQENLKNRDDILLLSFSVTPELDSVPVLKQYAEEHGADSRLWHLLTGSRDSIYTFARTSLFADVDTGTTALLHTETFYLIDRNGRIRGIYNGTLGTEVMALLEDVEVLGKEGNR